MIENSPPGGITTPNTELLDEEVLCSPEETQTRINFCRECDNFSAVDEVTKCQLTGCHINLMTTFKFKMCPKGMWQ